MLGCINKEVASLTEHDSNPQYDYKDDVCII